MLILNFFLAFLVTGFAIFVCGMPLVAFWDIPSIVMIGASVFIFLVGSGHVGLFFKGLYKSFLFRREENVAVSESFAKLCWFTPMIGAFWTIIGLMIILGNLDPDTVFAGVAVSLLTMFYAVFVTLFLFWPIAVRFRPVKKIFVTPRLR